MLSASQPLLNVKQKQLGYVVKCMPRLKINHIFFAFCHFVSAVDEPDFASVFFFFKGPMFFDFAKFFSH